MRRRIEGEEQERRGRVGEERKNRGKEYGVEREKGGAERENTDGRESREGE